MHRVHHTRFLWKFHKVHHAAEKMTMLNNFRNHPTTTAVRTIIECFPLAVLGIKPQIIMFYVVVTGIIVIWQHSDYDWNLPFVEKYILIGSSGHRLHHATNPKFYNSNFGILVFWDWIFGTLSTDKNMNSEIGVGNDKLYNTKNAFIEMFELWIDVFKSLISSKKV